MQLYQTHELEHHKSCHFGLNVRGTGEAHLLDNKTSHAVTDEY